MQNSFFDAACRLITWSRLQLKTTGLGFRIQESEASIKNTAVKFQDMIVWKISKSLKAYFSSILNSDY